MNAPELLAPAGNFEKMKTALTVLKVKGVLSPEEGEALNEMFNALLKLMAKYDL